IPEWKYFGYGRGRYTKEELKDLDSYAEMFGIELIPCVQTLAHLNEALRWPEFYDIVDCEDIMLVGEEKTYRFLDDMMRQLSECFTSRNINIGMDEAHMLGLGKYLDKHGYQNRSDIMTNHLSRVVEICKKYGFFPMMWSDMFFRLAYKGEYYLNESESDAEFPPEMLEKLRTDVKLVYWDYYSKDKNHYSSMIKRHRRFPNELVFAGGAYKWNGITPDLKFSYDATRAALAINMEEGVEEVFATGWGDDGAETPAFVVLPILQLFAEIAYKGANVSEEVLRARFKTCTKGTWDDFFLLDTPNFTNLTRDKLQNTTKPLLYQDVMLGLFDKHVDPVTFPIHFKVCSKQIKKAAKRNPQWSYLFTHTALISKVLSKKATLGIEITRAYKEGNKNELRYIAFKKLKKLRKKIRKLNLSFEKVWLEENKPNGLEVINIRLGGVEARLSATSRRLKSYLAGQVDSLEELESERLIFNDSETTATNPHCNLWGKIVTPSRMTW
ncbi:MAG: beta-N-acetylhexosaminidase, partial [Oscillospiraceae bacterium]|nr:beta-N-acetylhexosaminidase [Oscillospiraceae bacterium]MCL2279836.1 beta-N-acetylhexosaminidase [Oscillospiraceae bacterium]